MPNRFRQNSLATGTRQALRRLISTPLITLIRGYQLIISPLLGPRCRFWPSCSSYAIEAIQVHGPWKGGWMSLKRLLRCHPRHPGGMDPVPGGRSEALCQEDNDDDKACHHHKPETND